MENYRYEITNQSGDVVKQGTLDKNKDKETLVFTDLDPNGYYQIVIYGDYDLENGDEKQTNSELGRGSFVTRPLASLGYMQVEIDDKEVTQNSMNLGISIDTVQTDARLVAILNKVEVVIYDQGKNVESAQDGQQGEEQQQQETEIKRITLTDEQVEQLKVLEEVELSLEQLNSNTKYRIDVITTVKQGSVEQVVEDKQNLDQVITLKMPAEVQVRNQFVIGDMIDLDMRIEDLDGADLVNKVRIELRDKDNKLVDLSEMPSNADYERKVYEDLNPNETYRIIVYAPQYNIGSTDATYKADYLLKEIKIITEVGISGKLDLIGLEKTPIGKNLVDVSSKVNWFERCFNNNSQAYGLNYNDDTKILTLGGTGGYMKRTFYDLTKYLGQEVTISFKARSDYDTDVHLIEKNDNNAENVDYTYFRIIKDITNQWKEYEVTTTLNKSGYIGFAIANDLATVEIQDLQIELGNKKTDYEEFKYDYNANVAVTVNDARNEITTNDYYIKIYKNNEQIQELRYEELGEANKVENVQKTYNVESNTTYKIELLVKIAERFYELDSQEFSTDGSKEVKGILNLNDFLKIQPYGEYIVLNNINLSGGSGVKYCFGNGNLKFNGKINFNGNTIIKDFINTSYFIFDSIGTNGVIENIVLDYYINNEVETNVEGLAYNNYGTIKNIKVNVKESTEYPNGSVKLITRDNYGVIEKFVINLEVPLYTKTEAAIISYNNYGSVKNGYLYGKNVKVLNQSSSIDASSIVTFNRDNAIISNVYTLVNIDALSVNKSRQTNICDVNYDNSTIQNVYSVGIGENYSDFSRGPNIYSKLSANVYNNYYFTDEIFTSELETKGNMLSLWDAQFQNQLINGDNAFIVDDLVNSGFYPWIDMSDVMPMQDYIELPEVNDADLPDILSTKVLEQGTDTVKVQFSVNNPAAEQISDIRIENLDVEILSQEYNDGKSTVIAELKNPIICVSSYDVLSITTKGAFNSSYTRPYEKGERVINVDLYKEIWSINDWKNIEQSPTENYMLMADLDFINEGNTAKISNVRGIINGNGHNVSNINLTNNTPFIFSLYGTLENLYVNNFNQEATTCGGLLQNGEAGSKIDNVHMTNVNITKTGSGFVGGITRFAYSSCTITNSSVNNIQINTEGAQSEIYVGGIAGGIQNTNVENCYVSGLVINDVKGVSSGIGGIVGLGKNVNTIRNCYSEGTIISDNINVGGIVGNIATATIKNCYSKINISTTNSNVGGIAGTYSGRDISTISNNLSIGNIYTTSGLDSINRIVGSSSSTSSNNYAYENQLLNGYAREEEKGATLLNKEEVLNLSLGDSYNYNDKAKGILPKLYNTKGTELLPNQTDILIDSNTEENVNLELESIEATKPNTTEAEISVRIKNPEEIEITGIEVEDLTITSITRNVTQNGITNIVVRATPNRYYDSYKLTGIKYKRSLGEEQTKKVENEIEVQFYKEIYTYEDWQSIEEGTYQNYRLMADIDFTEKTNIKNNITVNRLEAENNVYTLKNIELSYNIANSGFINNVKTSMKNICFENVKITNTSGTGNYFGVIASNNGNLENLEFNHVTVDAKGMNYVGLIGGVTSGNIKNINIDDICIKGNQYVAGFIGNIDIGVVATIDDITENKVTVEGTGDYVGGFTGYQSGANIETNNLIISDSNINGKNYTGGLIGYFNYGTLNYAEIKGSTVSGNSYVGGISGEFYSSGNDWMGYYLQAKTSIINGEGNYIGGISGYFRNGRPRYTVVNGCTINATSADSECVGGMVGETYWMNIYYFQILNTEVISTGKNVGGVSGSTSGSLRVEYGYVEDEIISGNSSVGGIVGGIVGTSDYVQIAYMYLKVKVEAYSNSAGGAIGFLDNMNMTAASNTSKIYNAMIIDSSVTAPTKSGGLIGDIAKEIYRNGAFFYNNYIAADVTSENSSTGSLIIGGRPDENTYITNTYVYKYSTLNGDYVYASNDDIDDEQYLVRSDLEQQNTFSNKIGLGTIDWNYSSLAEEKYPTIQDSYLYKPELQTGVDLPTDPDITIINSLSNEDGKDGNLTAKENDTTTQSLETLPTITAYPVSVNEINIDFSSVPKETSFTYSVNGQEKDKIDLTKKTYTFKYNYQDTLEVKVTNGQAEETITINPDDVRSSTSLVGENSAYLLGTSLYINGELQQGDYVNINDGYSLNSSGQIVDIATKQIVKNANEEVSIDDSVEASDESTTTLEKTTKPLQTYNYKGSNIEVYGTYSTVDGNVKLQIYNVRNGQLSAISDNVDMKIGNSIIDNYNDKEYQTILTTSGELVDLKEKLQYPSNFLSSNIKQIVQNTDAEKTEMMVLYNTGKVIVFNYVNGNIIYENNEKADSSLVNYLTRSFANIWNDYEDRGQEYARSKELEAKLAKLPVEEAMKENTNNGTIKGSNNNITSSTNDSLVSTESINNSINNTNNSIGNLSTGSSNNTSNSSTNTTTDNNYITVYNADTGKYEVYSEDEILNGEDENPVSETEKIKENGLEGVYGYDTQEETKPQANGAIIVVSIIAVAIIALVILRKVIVKNSGKKEKNK